jgi:glucokinase
LNTLAIDIGGTKFSMALFKDERMVLRQTQVTQRDGGRSWMLDQIAAIAKLWRKDADFDCCGIGFGGPVDYVSQRVTTSNVVKDWQEFPLAVCFQEELGVPTVIDNDANVGALGEAVYGAGVGCDPLFYMTLSTGIGGGLVCEGQLYRGADSFAGEIGHIPIRPGGPQCACGAEGCLERMCSGLWLEADHGKSAKDLFTDSAFVERYVIDLAMGVKSAILLLNPARVVVGGGISKAGDALFVPLRKELRRQITSWSRARIDVVPSALGDNSVLYGALPLSQAWLHSENPPQRLRQRS